MYWTQIYGWQKVKNNLLEWPTHTPLHPHTDFSPEEKMGEETPSSDPKSSHYYSYQNGKRNLLEWPRLEFDLIQL